MTHALMRLRQEDSKLKASLGYIDLVSKKRFYQVATCPYPQCRAIVKGCVGTKTRTQLTGGRNSYQPGVRIKQDGLAGLQPIMSRVT